ncbi:unnamed protein product [Darwinula stevensoni]|uniref:Uncharacterized protein n=1 Tax=Darwinula stevensoni TaxID=69355 RepID=A0A7R8WZ95_9CRUS|nr:unnamed protein product [Darwinula stevensoni]CAG0880312.1 unnamed protein product [Darwinula stevensoni]
MSVPASHVSCVIVTEAMHQDNVQNQPGSGDSHCSPSDKQHLKGENLAVSPSGTPDGPKGHLNENLSAQTVTAHVVVTSTQANGAVAALVPAQFIVAGVGYKTPNIPDLISAIFTKLKTKSLDMCQKVVDDFPNDAVWVMIRMGTIFSGKKIESLHPRNPSLDGD